MRTILRSLAILMIVLALVPLAPAGTAMAQPELANTGEELVIITSDGQLRSVDRFTPAGYLPVQWESPATAFSDVATGDFDGDGSDEVVGLRGGEAVVYDPVPRPGEPNTARVFPATSGQVWHNVATGDLDGDGADELILVESSSVPGLAIQMYAFKFSAVNGWNRTYAAGFGALWQGLTTGDVMGNGLDQVIAIRNPGSSRQILIFNPANNWSLIHEGNYSFPWVAVAVGNVQNDSANKDEVVTTRQDVGSTLPSMLVFRWVAGSAALQDVASAIYYPEFRRIALADVNGSGVKDVFLLRSGRVNNTDIVALTNFRVGSNPPVAFNELTGQDKWGGLQAGDVDGDGKDEVIAMSANEFLIYTQPDVNTALERFPGSYSSNGRFAVGNLDGPGVPAGPTLSVSPLTVDRTLQAGQNGSEPITIANTGAGTLNWTATVVDGSAWLSLSSSSGVAPSTLQLLINTGGIAPDQYVGRVRIDAPGANNSPQTITVNLTVTAPQFAVQPTRVSWFYQPPANPGVRTVRISGQNVPWHAGLVLTSVAAQVEQAVAAGQPVKLQDGQLVIGDDANAMGTTVVDWINIDPVAGVAVPGGAFVDLILVLDRVPYGLSSVSVVFVADIVASPPAVVVNASVLRSLPNGADLWFLPVIVRTP
ncbi:MAG TPA: VCBS repeat-containing protein [Anaerolineae bacterium]|nr:VCBS repeat-containing protein [Anaerolineae bacterium]